MRKPLGDAFLLEGVPKRLLSLFALAFGCGTIVAFRGFFRVPMGFAVRLMRIFGSANEKLTFILQSQFSPHNGCNDKHVF